MVLQSVFFYSISVKPNRSSPCNTTQEDIISGFEIRPLLGMNQQTLLPEIEFFQIWLSFFEKN